MKKIKLIMMLGAVTFALTTSAQTKKDSLKLRADLDAIRSGRPLESKSDTPSVMRTNNRFPGTVDSLAVKPNQPEPTPPSPNNPNPYEPQPSPVHPNPPATPPEAVPAVPPGTPRGPGKLD